MTVQNGIRIIRQTREGSESGGGGKGPYYILLIVRRLPACTWVSRTIYRVFLELVGWPCLANAD